MRQALHRQKLKKPCEHRGVDLSTNSEGAIVLDGQVFDRLSDAEKYLATIPRKDIPNG